MIGRVLVDRLAPSFEQVCTHNCKQQQYSQAQPECDNLHCAGAAPASHVRETVAPGDADTGAKPAQQGNE